MSDGRPPFRKLGEGRAGSSAPPWDEQVLLRERTRKEAAGHPGHPRGALEADLRSRPEVHPTVLLSWHARAPSAWAEPQTQDLLGETSPAAA